MSAPRLCVHCQRFKIIKARGLCSACLQYERRNGTPRPAALFDREPRPAVCRRCRQVPPEWGGRCEPCARFLLDNGHERPEYLWKRGEPCRNCHAPRAAFPTTPFARGLCATCYAYRWRNGRHRPAALIRRQAPLGWCDCGALAVTVREIVVALGRGHERRYNERLCARCARAEEAA